jgi:ubiquinone/menaquinone biosynthesis C-methylase UbiE
MYIIRKTKNLLSQAIPLVLQNYLTINYWEQLDFDAEYYSTKIDLIFSKIKIKDPIDNFLEFGGSAGRNISYLNELFKIRNNFNIDINSVVSLNKYKIKNYFPIHGSLIELKKFNDNFFDLVLVCSVFDHIVSKKQIILTLEQLLLKSKKIIMVEPYIEGFEKNVSYLSRKDCGILSHKDYKIFSKNSFFWEYKKILNNLDCKYKFFDCSLHTSSFGPFYKVFEIEK